MRAGAVVSTAFLALMLSACSEVSLTKPDLALTPKPQGVNPPLELRVIDDQATARGGDYASRLAKQIHDAYPHAIELASTAEPVGGHATLTLHIHFLGAQFNKTSKAVLPNTPALTTAHGTVDDWRSVVAAAAGTGPVSSGTVFLNLSANWSGIAYMDAEIRDMRPGHQAALVIPIAAERSGPNKFGALQAQLEADSAWDAVAPRLGALLDATIAKLAAEQS